MEAVLQQINSVPGMVGGLVCDREGKLLAHVFPPLFDSSMLEGASTTIADSILGIEDSTDGIEMLDFRYNSGRVVVKPMGPGFLLLLCAKTINLQLLAISLNVALKKLEKLFASRQAVAAAAAAQVAPQTVPLQAVPVQAAPYNIPQYQTADRQLRRDGAGVVLTIDTMKTTANTYWDQMEESVAISKRLAVQISDIYETGPFKKIKLTNKALRITKTFSVRTIERDKDHLFDDRIVLTKAAAESLKSKPGDELVAELATGSGVFGWEGI